MTARLNLYDPGMHPKTAEYESPEAAIDALKSGLHPNYTDALLSQDGKVTHVACREVGETVWTIKERRHKP